MQEPTDFCDARGGAEAGARFAEGGGKGGGVLPPSKRRPSAAGRPHLTALDLKEFFRARPPDALRTFSVRVKSLPNNKGYTRYAVLIPLGAAKLSTRRNRIRRIFFEEMNQAKKGAFDIVFVIEAAIKGARSRGAIRAVAKEAVARLLASPPETCH